MADVTTSQRPCPDGLERLRGIEDLYRAHAPGLLAFLVARLNDAQLAEDVLHDVFLACLRSEMHMIVSPKAYLFSAAHRLSLNILRDLAVARRARGALERHTGAWSAAEGADPLVVEEARKAMDQLPNDEREVLALRVYGELTFQEIAELRGQPLTTVHRRHSQAIAAMRSALDGAKCRGGGA